jgi:hypothetical protein
MKNLFFSISIYFCIGLVVSAQNCITTEMQKMNAALYPEMEQERIKLEFETKEFLSRNDKSANSTTKIIPVVFHVLHQGGSENISMAQIRNQVRILNEEYQRLQADTILAPAVFKALAGKLNYEFRLATKDPNGNCTEGVTRTWTPLSSCIDNAEDAKYVIGWPRDKYLNIWLVKAMNYEGKTDCGGGGYAQFPGTGLAETDGVEIRHDLIGSIGTATTNSGWGNFKGRYLIHELGHWMNLWHIWGDATCGDDLVSDTPPAQNDNSGCPTFPHRANNTCGSDANGEMFNNYMDYSHGDCLNMFSKQQSLRIEAAMNSAASSRNNLFKASNLIATGTDTLFIPDCPSKPEVFPYTTKYICGSGNILFKDFSWGGSSDGRLWSFPGGDATNLTDSTISVTYDSAGIFNVGLSNTNQNGTVSKTFLQRVVVFPAGPSAQSLPAMFDYEGSNPLEGWTVINSNSGNTWSNFLTAGF